MKKWMILGKYLNFLKNLFFQENVSKTIKNEAKEQKVAFLACY